MYATQLANCHEALGHMYFLRGDDAAAEREWEWVWRSYESGDVTDAAAVAPALKNLADAKMNRQDSQGARDLFALALEVLERDPRYGYNHERCTFLRENVQSLDAALD
jgi:predicted metal-dependent hydrolase